MKLFEHAKTETPPVVTTDASATKEATSWVEAMIQKGKRIGPFSERVLLTPVLARVLLGNNHDNRKLREPALKVLVRDIIKGHWTFNGEAVIIAVDGELNDGQHRCAAVIRANIPIEVFMTFGVTRESRLTVDQGKVRTVADYLGMDGYQHASALGAALNLILQYRRHGKLSMDSSFRATKADQMEFVKRHPTVVESVAHITNRCGSICGGKGLAAFCHWVIWQVCGDKALVDEFMTGIAEGLDLHPHDPVLICRNRLIEYRGQSHVTAVNGRAEMIFRAWNARQKKQSISTIRIRGELPRIER